MCSSNLNRELVEVTDADGFDIPTLIKECVVVETENTVHTHEKSKTIKNESLNVEEILELDVDDYTPEKETVEGENINILLAFVPHNIKSLSVSDYDFFLINDSNYLVGYNIAGTNGTISTSYAACFIQPNTKVLLSELKKEELNDIDLLNFQMFAIKQVKAYSNKPVYDVKTKINTVKFYTLHSFVEND